MTSETVRPELASALAAYRAAEAAAPKYKGQAVSTKEVMAAYRDLRNACAAVALRKVDFDQLTPAEQQIIRDHADYLVIGHFRTKYGPVKPR